MPRFNIVPAALRRWAGQVAASATATLVAAGLYAALPRVFVPEAAPLAVLTTGGKFAARIAAADDTSVGDRPTADRAVVAPASLAGRPGLPLLLPTPMPILAEDFGSPAGLLAASRALRLPHRPALKREVAPPAAALVAALPAKTAFSTGATSVREEDGLASRLIATSRSAWNATAALGTAMLSRVLP